ncbi:hypothetical protein GCM10017687_07810 [Streptomyces echinatus]
MDCSARTPDQSAGMTREEGAGRKDTNDYIYNVSDGMATGPFEAERYVRRTRPAAMDGGRFRCDEVAVEVVGYGGRCGLGALRRCTIDRRRKADVCAAAGKVQKP